MLDFYLSIPLQAHRLKWQMIFFVIDDSDDSSALLLLHQHC